MKNLTMSSSSSRRLEELEASEDQMQLAWLPDEIMYLIMAKLMVFPVYLARISAVCKRWHRLVCDAWPKLVKEHQINTPIVVVPVVYRKEEVVKQVSRRINNLVEEVACQIYNLMGECALAPVNNSLPYGQLTRIIGSSFGWLIVTNRKTSVSLFNPLSKFHIRLPPLPDLYYAVKGVLSGPSRPEKEEENRHLDIAITVSPDYQGTRKTARKILFLHVEKIRQLESLQWVVHDHHYDQILDVNSIGGRICILHTSGTIWCCKCSRFGFSCYYGVRKEWPSWVLDGDRNLATVYLLESSSSEPLVVFRYKDSTCSNWPTVGFKILTLTSNSGNDEEINEFNKTWNWTEEKANAVNMMTIPQQQQHLSILNWTEIKTLGNDAIFLSDKASICIQASKLQQQQRASFIYHSQGTDFGVFNVDRNCLTQFSHRSNDNILGTKLLQRPPIWLQPSYDKILKFSSIG